MFAVAAQRLAARGSEGISGRKPKTRQAGSLQFGKMVNNLIRDAVTLALNMHAVSGAILASSLGRRDYFRHKCDCARTPNFNPEWRDADAGHRSDQEREPGWVWPE